MGLHPSLWNITPSGLVDPWFCLLALFLPHVRDRTRSVIHTVRDLGICDMAYAIRPRLRNDLSDMVKNTLRSSIICKGEPGFSPTTSNENKPVLQSV
jgi:hypothetical protein